MARFDVAARLGDGRPAVEDAQTLVLACRLRGYQHPDLTRHGAQLRDWYDTEDGLDLAVLDADGAALQAATQACRQAAKIVRAQVSELAAAWSGDGADAATDFVERHCAGGEALTASVDRASAAFGALRDELWSAVDAKVAATASIIGPAQRPEWLAAARAVIAGQAPEDLTAVVDEQVKPFVADSIQGDWLDAMRTAVGRVGDAYRAAIAALDGPAVRFDLPGDLGPGYQPQRENAAPQYVSPPNGAAPGAAPPAMAPELAVPPAPAAVPTVPASAAMQTPMGAPMPAEPLPAPPAPAGAPTAPAAMTPPDLGAATATPARMADAIGGLLGPAGAAGAGGLPKLADPALAKPDKPEKPDRDDKPDKNDKQDKNDKPDKNDKQDKPDKPDKPDKAEKGDEADQDMTDKQDGPELEPGAESVSGPEPKTELEPGPEPGPDAPVATDEPCGEPAVVAPPPPPVPGATPCEIAADELPQAGA